MVFKKISGLHLHILFLGLVLMLNPMKIYGQVADTSSYCPAFCCDADPTPAGIMISHVHKRGEWMLSYRFMRMNMGAMRMGTSGVSDNEVFQNYLMSSSQMNMDMHMLMAMYGITGRLTLMSMLNFNSNSMDMKMLPVAGHNHSGGDHSHNHDHEKMSTMGLGDAKLYALYSIVERHQTQLILSLGVSIPLGNIGQKGNASSMYPNKRLPYNMQLGSGTWDVLPTISWLSQKNKFTYSSQLSGAIRTSFNSIGYQLGKELIFNNWIAHQWNSILSTSLRLEGQWSESIKGIDPLLYIGNEPAANSLNYGGRKIFGFVGASVHLPKGWFNGYKVGAEFGIPLYQNLNGVQMKSTYSLNLSLSKSF